MANNEICGAKTRAGTPCKNPPVKGRKRCRMHGGTQPVGPANVNFKHGGFSKYASESLKEVLQDLQEIDGEDLTSPEHEIRLLQALIISSKALENKLSDLEDLERISNVVSKLIIAKQRSQKIMEESRRLVPADDLKIFLNFLENLLINHISQTEADSIISKLQTFKISDYENR